MQSSINTEILRFSAKTIWMLDGSKDGITLHIDEEMQIAVERLEFMAKHDDKLTKDGEKLCRRRLYHFLWVGL